MAVNVLILEDNPVARGLLSRVVRESFIDTHVITETADAQSARRHLAMSGEPSVPFKLVLLDLDLPRHQGLTLLSELAHDPAIKIVTALYADDEKLFPALQRGADGYLLKEAPFATLVEELQRAVRGQPPLSPALARCLLAHFQAHGSTGVMGANGHAEHSITSTPLRLAPPPMQPSVQPVIHVPTTTPRLSRLSKRETEVLTGLSKGFTVKEIAGHLGSTAATVYEHIRSVYRQVKADGWAGPVAPSLNPDPAGDAP